MIDLTGTRFGNYVVVARGPERPGSTMWKCVCDCGNERNVSGFQLKSGRSSRCNDCRIADPGTGWTDKLGYRWVRRRGKSVKEHRVAMEASLGRPLYPDESVHHKNGVRNDNRPENLELWVTHQPSGQRPEDLVEWAKEILRRYDT